MVNLNELHFTGPWVVLVRLGMILAVLFILAIPVLLHRLLFTLKRSLLSLPLSERVHIHPQKVLVPISSRTHSEDNRR